MTIPNIPYNYVLPILVVILLILIFLNVKKSKQINTEIENFNIVSNKTNNQEKLNYILRDIHQLTEKNNITYWIIGRTLSSVIKNILPNGDDADIAILDTDEGYFCDLFLNSNYVINQTDFGYKISDLNKKYPFIDIFVMMQNNEGTYEYKYTDAKK